MSQASPEVAKSLRINGMSINYHDRGVGDPILLIHGSGPGVTAWANWRTVIPELETTHRVVAPDMAGFGYTATDPDLPMVPEVWVRQIVELMDGLGIGRAVLIGNSFGGAVALATAARHPERVAGLVLMGAVGTSFPIGEGLEKVWGYRPSLEAMRDLLQTFAYDGSIITDDLVEMRYRASTRADVQDRFAKLFPPPRQRGVDMLALDDATLARIDVPVAVVHGRDDRVIPFAVAEALREKLPDATLHPIEACGHWVQIERRDEFLSVVRALLERVAAKEAVGLSPAAAIEGRWGILAWRQDYDDGRIVLPMGERPTGFIQYGGGRMVAMITAQDRPKFTTGGQWDASTEEKARAYETGLFYSGPYRVEGDTVFHEVEIASFPNWAGVVQKRRIRFDGERLALTARLGDGTDEARTAVLEWRRLA